MMQRIRTIAVAALVSTPFGASGAAAAPANFCRLTAQAVLQSCQADARSDNLLAVANCHNRADAAARKACKQQASESVKEGQQECREQFQARQEACADFGPAAYAPQIDPANFVAAIDNPYFPLTPGTTFIYEGQTADGLERVEFAVTHVTKEILGVTCIEVHDVVRVDGEVIEDTLDWFAQDTAGNVWYFGENTGELEDGRVVNIDGTFTAGVDEAKPGIIMQAHPAVGDFYRQEFSLDNAEDNAEVVSLTESVAIPFGTFANCLKTEETTPISPGVLENKYYAPGIGNVLTVDLETGDRSELKEIITE